MTSQKIAVLDLGSNTFQLAIALIENKNFKILIDESFAAKLGKDSLKYGFLTPAAIERGIEALAEIKNICNKNQVDTTNIYALGTSVLRHSTNTTQFTNRIKNDLDIDIHVIDGAKEAELIAKGIIVAAQNTLHKYLIMDIGAGSVEFIIVENQNILWKQSFEIGGRRLMDRFFVKDPFPLANMNKMTDFFDQNLIDLMNAIHQYQPQALVGSAGSFETLQEMYQAQLGTNEIEIFAPLSIAFFQQSFEKFLLFDRAKRLSIPGMIDLRVDMIVPASILINYIIQKCNIKSMYTSTYSLKEGVLAKLSNNEPI